MKEIIITGASTGNKWMIKDTPYLPSNVQQIIKDGIESFEAGAAMLHLHARAEDGTPTHDPKYMKEVIETLRKECPDAVMQMSVGGMEGKAYELLEPLLALRPELASFNLKSMREETVFMAELFAKYNVKPVIECFSLDMLKTAHQLLAEGILKGPLFIEMLFELKDEGRTFEQMATDLLEFKRWLPKDTIWSQTRGDTSHVKLQGMAAAMGGHIRTGLEDCIVCNGEQVKCSADLVKQAIVVAKAMGRTVATPKEARRILGV